MTDLSEGLEPEAQDDTDDPARAFENLSCLVVRTEKYAREIGAEMTTIRKDVEAAFEAFVRFEPTTDYGDELARMDKQLELVAQSLEALEKLPAIRYGPEHYARVLEMTGKCLSDHAVRHLESRGLALERVTNELREYVTNARLRRQQNWWIWGAGGVGLIAGILSTLFLPRLLPGSVDMTVSATAMNADRWNAGAQPHGRQRSCPR
jgi:hypothetical protein